jgi:hemerythrin-like domain-containing protein
VRATPGSTVPPAGPETPAADTVTSYLSADQARIDALLDPCLRAATQGDFEVARALFRHFESAFMRHLQMEEQVVFPVFEDRTGLLWGPTVTLRAEHRELRRAVAIVQEGLLLASVSRAQEGARLLATLVPDHDGKEKNVFFPMTDRLLTVAERAALVARMRRH